jgi:hypothetical protein
VSELSMALVFLLGFAGLLAFFTVRARTGSRPTLRRIRAFDVMKKLMGRAVESGRTVHVSLGVGSMATQTTADSLAGLSVLGFLSEHAAETGVPPIISMADPTVMLFAQNLVRAANADSPAGVDEAAQSVRLIAPQPAAYAAGVMNILDSDEVGGTVMVGNFGDEYLLMGETAARHDMAHIGGASDPNTLPFIYASAQETLLGEEIYAAGAYLKNIPAHIGSLVAQDTMRWVVALVMLGGVLVATLNLWWLWILVALLTTALVASIVMSSLR